MELERRKAILRGYINQLENSVEQLSFDMKVCQKVRDERGYQAAKQQALEIDKKILAAKEIMDELNKELDEQDKKEPAN